MVGKRSCKRPCSSSPAAHLHKQAAAAPVSKKAKCNEKVELLQIKVQAACVNEDGGCLIEGTQFAKLYHQLFSFMTYDGPPSPSLETVMASNGADMLLPPITHLPIIPDPPSFTDSNVMEHQRPPLSCMAPQGAPAAIDVVLEAQGPPLSGVVDGSPAETTMTCAVVTRADAAGEQSRGEPWARDTHALFNALTTPCWKNLVCLTINSLEYSCFRGQDAKAVNRRASYDPPLRNLTSLKISGCRHDHVGKLLADLLQWMPKGPEAKLEVLIMEYTTPGDVKYGLMNVDDDVMTVATLLGEQQSLEYLAMVWTKRRPQGLKGRPEWPYESSLCDSLCKLLALKHLRVSCLLDSHLTRMESIVAKACAEVQKAEKPPVWARGKAEDVARASVVRAGQPVPKFMEEAFKAAARKSLPLH